MVDIPLERFPVPVNKTNGCELEVDCDNRRSTRFRRRPVLQLRCFQIPKNGEKKCDLIRGATMGCPNVESIEELMERTPDSIDTIRMFKCPRYRQADPLPEEG